MKGKLGTLSLACVLGLSTFLVSGCGQNNNGVNTKNVGRGQIISNSANYRTNNSLGINGTRSGFQTGLNGTNRTYGTTNGSNRTFGTGANGVTGGGFGASGNTNNGALGTTGNNRLFGMNGTPGMGNYGAGGIPGGTSGYGATGMGAAGRSGFSGAPGTNGLSGIGSTSGMGGFGSTSGIGGFGGTTSTGGAGVTGGGFHSMSVSGAHTLQLGSLTIVGQTRGSAGGMVGQNWSGGTSHMTGTTGTRPAGSRFDGTAGIGTYSNRTGGTSANGQQTLTVSDPRAIAAIDRVNRALASPASLSGKSDTLAKDLSYILKHASSGASTASR